VRILAHFGVTKMITKLLKAWGTVKPWFIGFLLSTAGMFMGYNLGSETARELGG
jgi:hypothetical protein